MKYNRGKRKLRRFMKRLKHSPRLQKEMKLILAGIAVLVLVIAGITITVVSNKNKKSVDVTAQHIEEQNGNNEQTEQQSQTETQPESTQEATEEETQTEEATTSPVVQAQTVAQSIAESTSKNNETVISVSSTGHQIKTVNGITYVDGVLIANKTYSLPKDYAPGDLSSEVKQAFNTMQRAAAAEGLNIYISSGYRSYSTQNRIYNRYVAADGVQLADTYSARPGNSEHQTGLCFDLNSIDDSFAATPEGKWVDAHAQEYGFIVRYPKGKESITGYQYESWHLRYLGEDLATKVYNSGLCLEEYFGITSRY